MRINISRLAGVVLVTGLSLVFSFGIALGQQEAASPRTGAAETTPWCPPPAPEAAPGVPWAPPPGPEATPGVGWCPPPAPEAAPGVPWAASPPPETSTPPPCPVCPPVPQAGAETAPTGGAKPAQEMAKAPDFEEGLLPQTGTSMGPETYGQHWGPYPDDVAVQLVGPTDFQGPAYGPYGLRYGREYEEFPAGVPAYLFQDQRLAQAERAEEPQAGAMAESPYEEIPVTLNMDDARAVMGTYLAGKNDPSLKLSDLTDMGDHFEALILNPQGCAVERVTVDKCKSLQSVLNPCAGVPEPTMQTSELAVCLTEDDARRIMQGFLATKDPCFTLGAVQDMGTYFEAPVLTPQGCAVQKLTVCKSMGVRTEKPEPSCMPQAAPQCAPGGAPCPSPQAGTAGAELTQSKASAILGNYVQAKDPSLKIGTIQDREGFFEASLLDKQNNVVETVRIDKAPPHMISSFAPGEAPQAGESME